MLGRLLHLGTGGSSTAPTTQATAKMSRPVSSLESVQEDIHTRNLLFPDAHALYQHRNDQVFPLSSTPTTPATSTANAFDFNGDVDLDVRDVRVIVMQDALGPSNASLLFDSHPAPPASPTERSAPPQDSRRYPPLSPRKSSLGSIVRPLVIQSDGSQPPPRQGAFDRRASLQGRQSQAETDAQRASREYREELATFSGCIFGNSELMSYKGTSTKVHVVPGETRAHDTSSSILGDGRSSIGRSSGRSSRLSQSYSSQTVSPTHASALMNPSFSRQGEKKKVLITRLFPVNLAVDDTDPNTTPPSRYSDENAGFPFPATGDEPVPKKKKPQPKQRRTPMYAVVLVVQLPSSPASSTRLSQATQPKSAHRESSSYTDQEFFPSSFSSARPSGWTLVGSGTYGDTAESAYSIDMEDRIDSLTQHWDIIMRTLTHLQSVVATVLGTMLKQVDLTSPSPFSTSAISNHGRTSSFSDRRTGEPPRVKPPKSTTKLVSLWPNCLADDTDVAGQVDAARHRIVMGLSAARVVTGQGRWGIWRDEARWTSKWAGSVERGQFFYTLLSGFLATHTDWLQALCPPSYRRRLFLQQKNRSEEDLSLPARTIIISEDKMAARRLIFLLSAFLPANQQIPTSRAHRPSTSTSVGTYSNSPPTFIIPVLREESLRRKINRRTGLRRASHSRTTSHSARSSAVPVQLAHLAMDRNHERRVSDATSIRPSNLPISGNDFMSRKSSAATTTTVMPETTMPHFSTAQRVDNRRRTRPSSSGSVAADDLKRSLKRGESTGQMSNASTDSRSQSSRWGSVISGLWSARRRDSATLSSYSQADPKSPTKQAFTRPDKLSQMVEEAATICELNTTSFSDPRPSMDGRPSGTPRDFEGRKREPALRPERTPDPNGAFESPVKTSINADDGVIDVDIPFPDYMTSFESAISSPSSSGYLSTPGFPGGLDSFEQASRWSVDGDLPLNAAGWLNRYHPDFAVQAIPPQEDLLEQVKASLRAEPTPAPANPLGGDLTERWVDVSCVMIADTTTSTITRIRYRRLVKPRAPSDRQPIGPTGPSSSYGGALLTPSILPYETQLEEEWIEEPILQPDGTLTEAVEKVTSLTQETSKDPSSASSQTHSEVRMSTDGEEPMSVTAPEPPALPQTPLEVPRVQCKTVVLSALEDTIREVIDLRERGHLGTNGHPNDAQPNLLHDAISLWLDNLDIADT
ncbi:folliculin-interacting protein N-terminus-domain-containing protein [Dactylonectria estremocensis]|uniref:Folliculin-interacting protein N-terminus-domain-containing protein n=1 Tax=Dactylonectria estremocensis TaxID=1079267 RepID=A0A9P9F2U6_9HYPO|nr:folliculin-interacting protein N-terminus-domain-containing protein [Dactylonectria estremocensis]